MDDCATMALRLWRDLRHGGFDHDVVVANNHPLNETSTCHLEQEFPLEKDTQPSHFTPNSMVAFDET